MRYPVLIDSNVPITANGKADHANEICVESCIMKLIDVRNNGRVMVDSYGLIFAEYAKYLSHKGEPGVGDMFFKWLWDNQGRVNCCTRVDIEPEDHEGFEFSKFPSDSRLENFDKSDRKFVAVALASGEQPPIINATDSDWLHFEHILGEYSVKVENICLSTLKK